MFLPESIDLAYSERYNLSIRLSPNGFSFCIYASKDATIFHYQETEFGAKLSYLENIKKLIFDLGFFSQTFNRITITVVSNTFTLIPAIFLDKSKVDDFFRFNFHNENGVVLIDAAPENEIVTLFDVNSELHSFLTRHLWNPTFHHHSFLLTEVFKSYKSNENEKRCFVDFHDKYITIICFEGERLLSINTFQATDAHDTIYFIASVWEKQSFDQSTDLLFLSGNIDTNKTTVDLLNKLIRRVEEVELNLRVMITQERKRTLPTDIIAELCV